MADEKKTHGGGRLSEEDRTEERTFIEEAALDLEKELTESMGQELVYDSAQKRWKIQERESGRSSYIDKFCEALEELEKNKEQYRRYTRNYRDEVTELMEDVWSLREWIKQSVEGEI